MVGKNFKYFDYIPTMYPEMGFVLQMSSLETEEEDFFLCLCHVVFFVYMVLYIVYTRVLCRNN